MSSINSDIDDFSSDEESNNPLLITSKKKISTVNDAFDQDEEHSEENDGEEDITKDSNNATKNEKEDMKGVRPQNDDNEKNLGATKEDNDMMTKEEKTANLKKRLALVQHMRKNSKHKTGVIYLSSIPPYMKPARMRHILSRFGEVDRLFLKRETDDKHKRRVKGGGNKKTMYEEGWAEFVRKRDAKLCAITLNGNIIGGKKGTFYHDDILNVKYLPGFKWADLTEQIARENDVRQAKLEIEISQANKLNADFIKNVEQSKMIANIKNSRKRNSTDKETEEGENRRNFKQHKVATNRADAPKAIKNNSNKKSINLNSVLSNLL
ncbi:similar to Saccharomyces cerevisiae YNR054C ESF2 Essential nucleolar protein involved in pre- 18S rRNA processing [Maudiozyma barnettii]|uniref:Pre-rRNA-processing protein ESF2 n=1 Tax=Maudiozyma barnettii TaxID=61262 RepID=A0A8H2ZKR8_9SACH|nr:RNA-binding ATPase activator ESF2 [Kazachstania barnettii]CAB4255442.1 similar to Saccharomyces cerevisiae YNR054C ESF2 Essential nucleolar protein involved in pre- 18S rRNA processing [Kazachstania barnettii]CAD1783887.1 similar to Saccharomyces cerevisiae YNR054C ESF2 Essential nucleolar protein involved in pre- 18S rRNA processing [Kazachstania barnettii]